MGTIMRGICQECGLQSNIYVGGGLMDCRPEAAIAISGSDKGLIAALEQDAAPFRIERRAAVCPRCKKLIAAARVAYGKGGDERHTVPCCNDCKAPIPWPKEDAARLRCPVCGHDIILTQAGYWD